MRLVLTIFWIILAFFILWIFSLNISQTVDINLFFSEFKAVSLVSVTLISLFLGFIFGIIFFLIQFAKSKKEIFLMRKQIKTLQQELANNQQQDQGKQQVPQISSEQVNDENNPDVPTI